LIVGKFHEVDPKSSVNSREEQILKYWQAEQIPGKSVTDRAGSPRFIFYEGPPTANGKPGIHHVLARTLKDTVCRYQTMQGFQVNRKAGWDTHGLPVEIEVEKTLGLTSKQDIEAYGIEPFNRKCRESVFTYEQEWRRMTERIGYWLDMDYPYITLDNSYIESVWWILKRFFDAGLIYEGHKIMPYCSRCGTPLASHEVSLGYKDETIDSVYVRMRIKDQIDQYFLVWTTTPWTLPANVALAVNPGFTYVRVRRPDETASYIVVRDRVAAIFGADAEILEELRGESLIGMAYEQLLPLVSVKEATAFKVYGADFVSTEDGSGIVHIAPAFGEDDYQMGKKYGLPFVQPVDKEGKFTAAVGLWQGRFVREADPDIVKHLKREGLLVKKERLTHSYPYCWRCDTPLLYYARKSWYIATTRYKEKLIANNQRIHWFPEHVGKGRFGNWLENLVDWSLSRDRYWGTPLNIWRCESCNRLTAVGSRRELADRACETIDPDSIELHRPYIDEVHLTCECGGRMSRTSEVIDCWFDSGSMPYAQHHYPFEHKDDFGQLFPADFICEGIDQTRGWFYSLLAIGTFLFEDQPTFRNVLVNDLLLDKNGQKMSKTRGNAVEPWKMIEKYGADATRWYLLAVSPPWTPTRFDEDGLKDVFAKFFGTLQNITSFFTLYANIDNAEPDRYDIPVKQRQEIDRWILSKLNTLIAQVRREMETFELTRAVRAIQAFVIDAVSNWYVRRSRERFWAAGMDPDKQAVYRTLWEVLITVAKLIAPFAPFIAEEIYLNLTQGIKEAKASIHLELYPESDPGLIDALLEKNMGLVIDLVSMGRAARNKVQIKVRQPLALIKLPKRYQDVLTHTESLIKEELNIKSIEYIENPDAYVAYTVKPLFPVLGPKYGKLMQEIAKKLGEGDAAGLIQTLRSTGTIQLTVSGNPVTLTRDDVEVRIEGKSGFAVEIDRDLYIVLDIALTPELVEEGLARELISKVQNMRKTAGFELTDRITLEYVGDDRITAAFAAFREYIMAETLATTVEGRKHPDSSFEKWDINGHPVELKVKKV
jgi:isoleucyl-tRNA synthetase